MGFRVKIFLISVCIPLLSFAAAPDKIQKAPKNTAAKVGKKIPVMARKATVQKTVEVKGAAPVTRRVPVRFSVPFSGERSHTDIDRIVDEFDPSLNIGVLVRDLDTGKEIASRNANRHFTPSSVAKVFTAAAAVKKLGPDFTFDTSLYLQQGSDGHSVHNVAFRFVGDPTLKSADLVNLLSALHGKTISGNVYIDETLAGVTGTHGGWLVEDTKRCYGAPVGAIMVNKNCNIVPVANGHAKVPVQDPHDSIEDIISSAFEKNNIHFQGKYIHAHPDYNTYRLAKTHHSSPLSTLLTRAIKKSDNTISDAIFLQIGRGDQPGGGMWDQSQKVVKKLLAKEGVDLSRSVLMDGSGLTRHNLVTPRQMSDMLHAIYASPILKSEFNRYFPISGIDGTLRYRLVQEGMVGKVQAKTGTMRGSSGLAGFVETQSGRRLSFVIFMNNIYGSVRPYLAIQNRILHYLYGA